jgi:recombination protein RecT
MSTETAVTPKKDSPIKAKSDALEKLVMDRRDRFTEALGNAIGFDQFAQMSLNTIRTTPALLQCTTASLLGAMFTAATLGMRPAVQDCYFVPYKDTATFILGYKGLLRLVRRAGLARSIFVGEIYEGDEFRQTLGSSPDLLHIPQTDRNGLPVTPIGDPVAYYAVIHFVNGGKEWVLMTREQIEIHRDKFSKAKKFGPWVDHFDAMAKKTVLRKLCGLQDLAFEIQQAVAYDERPGTAGVYDIGKDVPAAIIDEADEYFETVTDAVDVNSGNDATAKAADLAKN